MPAHQQSGAAGQRSSDRGRGRELSLWLLCHVESHPSHEREAIELFWREPPAIERGDEFIGVGAEALAQLLADPRARRHARRLIEAYLDHAEDLDAQIERVSARWRIARMDQIDRNLLRIAAVELAHESTPRNVIVAEAVRLAARYGSERSVAFVNALAEALARTLRDASPTTPEPDEEGGAA